MIYFYREWKYKKIFVMFYYLLDNKNVVIWGGKISIGYRLVYKVKFMVLDYWYNGIMIVIDYIL